MAKYLHTGSFNYQTAGIKTLVVVPIGVDATLAIANNSNQSFTILLSGAVTVAVKPYGIARIGFSSGGFSTTVAIRTKGPSNGAFIVQQTASTLSKRK
ncbi:hypothetical protein AB4Z22_03670 [Paenibacillus sp. TAF58]